MLALLLAARISLLDFSIAQWRKEPQMRIEDAYKWLYQATLGGEHAVADDTGPRAWMENEWPTVGNPLVGEPEVVKLSPDGKLMRVNLRPYKTRGGNEEMLLAIFIRSAQTFHAPKRAFITQWKALGRRLVAHPIGRIDETGWRRFDSNMSKSGYPSCEHSAAYEKSRRPAYRVVLGSLWIR